MKRKSRRSRCLPYATKCILQAVKYLWRISD